MRNTAESYYKKVFWIAVLSTVCSIIILNVSLYLSTLFSIDFASTHQADSIFFNLLAKVSSKPLESNFYAFVLVLFGSLVGATCILSSEYEDIDLEKNFRNNKGFYAKGFLFLYVLMFSAAMALPMVKL